MNQTRSKALFKEAAVLIPGGVNSPVRAGKAVGTTPLFIDRAQGAEIVDADGNVYIDYIGSWGPMILGHRHSAVMAAIETVLKRGLSFGASTDLEARLARMVADAVPSIEMVRMVNSGTEATMSAIRLARGITGRDGLVKFDGCYHGHADMLLVDAGSGVATQAIPGSPGVPADVVRHTISLPYNNTAALKDCLDRKGEQIACVIVEPVAGNMGMVEPDPGFLSALRKETEKHGCLLIFDEVMSGFRVAYGGAQARYRITPDITCLGKVIGGGMPVGAYGGSRQIMKHIAPEGNIYQAGTLSGNPVAMAAGIATLSELKKPGVYEALEARTRRLADGLARAAADAGVPVQAHAVGAMLGLFFADRPVTDFASAKTSDLSRFAAYYRAMLEKGIFLAPSQFEAIFVSTAHTDDHIDRTVNAAKAVFADL
ncbi:glutamate-1-semialdehyde 2,1-aminomutase [Desulfosudis oleivorans]|uniref:Glutamate-1-semialdehyde 2,1-aminomutase n=1 Tax=Desulfosudis oleivorans (strain DSM 6200 / JCM 39069 / Hxd3) TaxID=96561 RepID=GSA_DESOH|nr:glutamate-1-semialdehyde 2,1-aminomutase [Desulfosudis oleivorans]A8ZZU9.1 RecName: Full=Glutamate-1-semialdehyde 2,1-aminomutase; Short=GSA; AltName: Full=Glutamate-1-semialdehyde aminotransferase; Short=GSA-AT [Desulfosudis oleivorans Hxd3]ABW67349.1 glutamate-1-semialdehyde-2,1-aminomutase [Desulfosudis oleivorans Hxd3]